MKNQLFYNNISFRVVSPLIAGVLVYMLVLMFFDSVDMLAANFFSREVLFVICLTILFFEFNRLVIVILNKVYPFDRNIKFRIIIQYALSFIFTLLVISLSLYYYFSYIEGFRTIRTELITFNSIFLFAALFYHLYFFSLNILNRKNEHRVQKELHKKENVQYEVDVFKNQVNPEFLFQSLEVVIAELYQDKKHADELIGKLAKTYRYTLDNNNQELVPLNDELEALSGIFPVFRKIYFDAVDLILPKKINDELHIIPGTLQILLEYAIMNTIITEALALKFRIEQNDKKLKISFTEHKKITNSKLSNNRFEMLNKTYSYYSSSGIISKSADGVCIYEIPLLEIEEE